MAFNVNGVAGGYGSGKLGEVSNPAAQINSYARVTGIGESSVTIGVPSEGNYSKFEAGETIMIHVSAGDTNAIGTYSICNIESVEEIKSGDTLTGYTLSIDKDISGMVQDDDLPLCKVQAIVSADFDSLILNEGTTISPIVYDATKCYGGILFIRCKTGLYFNGGHILLDKKGIPAGSTDRKATSQETVDNIPDTGKQAGWENSITQKRFLLNKEGGALFAVAKRIAGNSASRIGNVNASGVQYTRTTNLCGGSTILLACDRFTGFAPAMIAKQNSTNRGNATDYGFARCYIASGTKLPNDEALYAYDTISNPDRLTESLGIMNYGGGTSGDGRNPNKCVNNYAKIVSIKSDGKTITIDNMTTDGITPFAVGTMVMVHSSKQKNNDDISMLGKFRMAKIDAINGNIVKINTDVSDIILPAYYNCQMVAVPQFTGLTISTNYSHTPTWNETTGIGGICAMVVNGVANLSDGKLNVENKGGGAGYGAKGFSFIGNAQCCDILPLGAGHGSVFLLAKSIEMNTETRIGATYDGGEFGGMGGKYSTHSGNSNAGGGYVGKRSDGGAAGSGSGPRTVSGDNTSTMSLGGYGSNAGTGEGKQGAHIMLIADTINGFNISAISTGGAAGSQGR